MNEQQLTRLNWLCEQIEKEQNHERLMKLIGELNNFLEAHPDPTKSALQQPVASNREHVVESDAYELSASSTWIADLLKQAIDATSANFGNVQLFDCHSGTLQIVAQKGFQSEFLSHFEIVKADDNCACGAALKEQSRVIVPDVASDSCFTDSSQDVLLNANVRSVQSTPLIDGSGRLLGILSTHYRQPGVPSRQALQYIDDLAAKFIEKIPLASQ